MPKFGPNSLKQRATLHPKLQIILDEAIKYVDFSITCGHRGESDQNRAFAEGKSKTPWPKSKHNSFPSRAVDIAPYNHGIDWQDAESFTLLAGIIYGIACMKGIKVRLGADWDGDLSMTEHKFKDRPHIELAPQEA